MQLLVSFPTGKTAAVSVGRNETVERVKQRILLGSEAERLFSDVRLVHACRVLQDRATIEQSKIGDLDSVQLMLALRGGMPKKGKKKKEKTEGSSAANADTTQEEEDEFPDLDIRPERWINLQVKLTTWDHLNFSILLRTSTRLYAIVEKIKERHGGSIKDITLYKHQVKAENSLPDLGMTLDEAGFEGGTQNDPRNEILEYDYKAHDSECSLLLSSPRGASRKDIQRKVQQEADQEARLKAAAATAAVAVSGRRKSIEATPEDMPTE